MNLKLRKILQAPKTTCTKLIDQFLAMEPEYYYSSSYIAELGRNYRCRPSTSHEHIDPRDRDLSDARREIDDVKRLTRELQCELGAVRANRDSYYRQTYLLESKNQDQATEIEQWKSHSNEREAENASLKRQLEQARNEGHKLRENANRISNTHRTLLCAYDELKKARSELQELLRGSENETLRVREDMARLDVQLGEKNCAVERLRLDFDEERDSLDARLKDPSSEKEKALDETKRLGAEIERQNSKLQGLHHKLHLEQAQNAALVKKVAMLDLVRIIQEASISACWMHGFYASVARAFCRPWNWRWPYILPRWPLSLLRLRDKESRISPSVRSVLRSLYRGYYV